ncbi:MAG: anthranilate synthase component I [Pseudomonadota bacterium]
MAGPDAASFADRYDAGAPQLVWRRRLADLETPVSAYLKLAEGRRSTLLLESVEGGEVRGRYSVIGLEPDLIWRAFGDRAEVSRPFTGSDAFHPCDDHGGALPALRALLGESALQLPEGAPPLAAGVFGYLGYDMVRLIERLSAPNPDPIGAPDAVLLRPTVVAVFDALRQDIFLATPVRPAANVTASEALAEACARLDNAEARLDAPLSEAALRRIPIDADRPSDSEPSGDGKPFSSNTSEERYREMVEAARRYIVEGDIFQAVVSQRFSAPFAAPPFLLYRTLRRTNPAPFLFFLDLDDGALVGSSPEILVRLRGREVTVRPIAGTRPRGATPATDAALEAELLADPKERAEHLMLLDLGRNDVGRVAEIGTVSVTEQYVVERYSHVMHIVSNVTGALRDDLDALDALIAGFPAGTVSGAPKIRAMEIIDELETHKRGPYGGAVGYFSASGDMDTCIVLRTAFIREGTIHVQAGAGVVADSKPEAERLETVAKARAVIAAAEIAERAHASARGGDDDLSASGAGQAPYDS